MTNAVRKMLPIEVNWPPV